MKKLFLQLLAILICGLIFRLLLLSLIHNPGLNDQNHYYNLGRRLLEGQGFTIDYVWQYSHVPDDIVHPIDHWMPLAGVAVALGMSLGGINPHSALILFILTGTLLPLLVFIACRQLQTSDFTALIATTFAMFLPDIVWNSLRSDSTILNMVFITGSILLLIHGLQRGQWWAFVLSGIGVGLAYLTRNDSVLFLPMLAVVILCYFLWGRDRVNYRTLASAFIFTIVAFILTITPWLIRNQREIGMLGTAETGRMFFMVDQRDHYAYDTPITLETMLQQQTVPDLITKRLFELGASIKQMLVSLDLGLAILVPLGFLILIRNRDKHRLLLVSPALIWLIGILIAYPILLPYKSQSGSFEKAYLTIVPLLIPLGALALDHIFSNRRWQIGIASVIIALMVFNSYNLVKRETDFADTYYASIEILVDTLETLPDVTRDGEVRIMSQDPYVMSTYGVKSVMTPYGTREQTIELAQRYSIDYLLMPPGRPALDDLYLGKEVDERFVLALHIADAGVVPFELYRFEAN